MRIKPIFKKPNHLNYVLFFKFVILCLSMTPPPPPFVFKEIPVPPKLGYFLKLSFAYKIFLQVKCKI